MDIVLATALPPVSLAPVRADGIPKENAHAVGACGASAAGLQEASLIDCSLRIEFIVRMHACKLCAYLHA